MIIKQSGRKYKLICMQFTNNFYYFNFLNAWTIVVAPLIIVFMKDRLQGKDSA